jgi:ADP-heptose:LPS heptosyltransferase
MPFVALNPASAKAIKQWGAARYAALSDTLYTRYHVPSVLLTADMEVAAEVMQAAQRPLISLAGRTNLKQLACVLEFSEVHVCGDTGSGHLAAALGRPVVSIIGPTDPERVCPYGQRANTLSRRESCGKDCDWHHCEFAHPRCLDAIAVAQVADKVGSLLPPSALTGGS